MLSPLCLSLAMASAVAIQANGGGPSSPPRLAESKAEPSDVLWISLPGKIEAPLLIPDRYYTVPEKEGWTKRAIPAIAVTGKLEGKRCQIHLGVFASEDETKAACTSYLSSCAARAEALRLEDEKPLIGDGTWALGSAIVFHKGRTLWEVVIDGASREAKMNFARALADLVLAHPAPYVLVTTGKELPTTAISDKLIPSLECIKVTETLHLEKGDHLPQVWQADLKVLGADKAQMICFEFSQGCLIYGRNIIAARGSVQVWGSSTTATYLSPEGKTTIRPAIIVGKELSWGSAKEITLKPSSGTQGRE